VTPILACVVMLPASHPEGPGPCVVHTFLIRDGDAAFLVDTGVGSGSAPVDSRYRPQRTDLLAALAAHGVPGGRLAGIVCSHLHFDHCGNNRLFPGVPIYVQRTEYEAAHADRYTVRDWLMFERADYRLLDGGLELAPHVRVVPTPGHDRAPTAVVAHELARDCRRSGGLFGCGVPVVSDPTSDKRDDAVVAAYSQPIRGAQSRRSAHTSPTTWPLGNPRRWTMP
jgi:glyoxylase-like metal-dependent hydrolase (beta-lactamase superfamily II)